VTAAAPQAVAPRAAAPAPARRGVPWWAWAAVVLAALLLRLAVVEVVPRRILFRDGVQYEEIGRMLHEQGTYGLQSKRPPGYPTLIAGVYAVLGTDLFRLRVVEAMLGAASVALIGAVGASLFGPAAGLVAALLAAAHPVLALLPATQYSENTLVLVMVLAFAAAYAAWRRGGLWRWALAGVLFGLALLTRPNVVLMLPGAALGFGLALARGRRGWLAPLLVTALAAALVVAPWIVRNQRVYHRWFFVATGGGYMLYAGNSPLATGTADGGAPLDAAALAELARQPDAVSSDRLLFGKALTYMREHPGRAARLYLLKIGSLFALYPTPMTRTALSRWWALAAQAAATLVLYAGALLALPRLRRTPELWPLLGSILTFAVVNSLFWTVMRYRMAFEPCLLWMAGLGWVALLERRRVNP